MPRPKAFPINYPLGKDLDFSKDYKKLNYLPLETWQKWYQSKKGFSEEDLQIEEVKSYGNAFKIARVPKVAIDRTTRATNFYHTGFVQFNWISDREDTKTLSGLYFLLFFPTADSELEQTLKAALHFLGEEGIGGERSSSAGRFEVEWNFLSDQWKEVVTFSDTKQHSLISMFWESPLDTDLLNEASYELQERGGWITSPSSGRQSRRKSVQMFAEGSVFSGIPQGQLADVTPDGFNNPRQGGHKIYRSGVALSLPVKIHDANE